VDELRLGAWRDFAGRRSGLSAGASGQARGRVSVAVGTGGSGGAQNLKQATTLMGGGG
jgi:hypothetical protein